MAPCKLPNEFLSDPPLDKVVSKTAELGARGRIGAATTWSAAIYRTELDNDIQFISSGGAVNAGFFQNVGKTRRQGIELAVTTHAGPVKLDVRYNHIDATFRSTFSAFAPDNSSADADGAITVEPGDRIPGIPADSFKLRAEFEHGPFSIGAGLVAAATQYAHGDENNADAHGKVPGYVVVNLDAQYEVTPRLQIFAQIANVFDKRYYSFAVLGEQHVRSGAGHGGRRRTVPRRRRAARDLDRRALPVRQATGALNRPATAAAGSTASSRLPAACDTCRSACGHPSCRA
jgi:outer membrane receptor protein involved in Fe transport